MSDNDVRLTFTLPPEDFAQFLAACLRQHAGDPREVIRGLVRDYAQLNAPKPYDRETEGFLTVLPGGAS